MSVALGPAVAFQPATGNCASGRRASRRAAPPTTPRRPAHIKRPCLATLALGRPGVGRGDAQQVPRHLPADGHRVYLVLHRPARRWLAHPGPYLAIIVALAVFSPVIIWNATHNWASFLFQGGRAVGSAATFRPDGLLLALLAQALYLFPWIWVQLIAVLSAGCWNWRRTRPHERLLLALSIAPLCVFTLVACFRPVLPHWGLIGLASLFPLLGRNWSARLEARPLRT